MPRRLIKRYLPDHATLKEHKSLRVFGQLILEPNLWHLNKRSVSGAFSVGLFCAFIPVPFQMLLAAGGALLFRVNLPVSVALVWITNPITMPPIFYFAYVTGAWVLGLTPESIEFALNWHWLKTTLLQIWQPFLLGCLILGSLSAIAGNLASRLLWRFMVVKNWRKRQLARRMRTP